MRLVCPNCDAQYDVDDRAIPASGRDVQCSACGHGWFERPGPAELRADLPEPAVPVAVRPVAPTTVGDVPIAAPPPPPVETVLPPAPPPRRPLDETVMAVLREEALREAAVRRAEAARASGLKPDPGLAAAETARHATPEVRAGAASDSGPVAVALSSTVSPAMGPVLEPVKEPVIEPVRNTPRRELLPDIEEINSSLSARSESRGRARGSERSRPADAGRGGFRTGFLAMVGFCAVLALAYTLAPRLALQIPSLAEPLQGYVETVDSLRLALSQLVERAKAGLRAATG